MAQKAAASSFNDLHSAFVTTEDGTSLAELLQVLGCVSITPILIPLLIPWVVPPRFAKQAVYDHDFFFLIKAIVEYQLLMVFPVWAVTVFAGQKDDANNYMKSSGTVFLTLLLAAVGILIVNHSITAPRWLGFARHWQKIREMPTGWASVNTKKNERLAESSGMKISFITNYIAIVINITVLCILAVDFSIFPRRFAKTKTYGISLMDVGTGCFVFANGIVAPEARGKRSPILKSLKSAVPLIILGIVRLITVKGIEYQEVVEEYGVHWNFFFTLAGVKILSSGIFNYFNAAHGLKLASAISILYEALLSQNDLQNSYILNPTVPRDSLISANREGVFSVFGYLSIYIASVYVGKLIYWKNRVTVCEWSDHAFRTFLQITILWTLYAIVSNYWNLPCRRTSNLSYTLLMLALNYSLLWIQMFMALLQVCLQHLGLVYGPILFYELAAKQRKDMERIQQLQRLGHPVIGKKKGVKSDRKKDDLDEQLHLLEEQLQVILNQVKEESQNRFMDNDWLEKILSIEEKINTIEEKSLNNASDEDTDVVGDEETRNNLVLMPDFSKSPVILEALCYNGLAVFLLGNLLTGLINCCIYTMFTPPYLSLCYLWFYVTVITAFSTTLYWFKLQLKFW